MTDKKYLEALARGLGLKNTSSLTVIMGPEELKEKLKGLQMKDFDNGIQLITLHTHTTASDGQVKPENYLDNALEFKNKYGYKNLLLAVTDHDTVEGLLSILKVAQKNPQKYEGIRIVLGVELSVLYEDQEAHRPIDFEVLHYGINPFDQKYAKWLSDLRSRRQKLLPKIFELFSQKYPNADICLEEFLSQNPLMRKGFGCYLAYITPRYILSKLNDPSQTDEVWDYFRRLGSSQANDPKQIFWHKLDEILTKRKEHQFGFLSVAHPYRISFEGKIRGDGCSFMRHFLDTLHLKGIEGLEVFYMNLRQPLGHSLDAMMAGYTGISETDRWTKTILDYADSHDVIKTGGTDSHTSFLAGRKKQIVFELTEKLNRYKPLIQQGYKVLKKEMTLGLPAPCMPPISRYRDTGIGSEKGMGAKRITDFFGKIFDKIQLGPMGATSQEFKHSPYVSSSKANPFLIPLEKLAEEGLLTSSDLQEIYDDPKTDGKIDFEKVSLNYTKALHKAYLKSQSKLSYEEFIELKRKEGKDPAKFIADLQVKIPEDTPGLKTSMFLKGYSLGSPPDQFTEKARNWGFSVFDPDQIFDKKGKLGPAGQVWYSILERNMKNAKGGLRIDHYIGFVNPYVISEKDYALNGRLYSSPSHPVFSKYTKRDFTDITKKIVLACARKNGLTAKDIYVEDIGSRPEELDPVLKECGLGRLLVAQFTDPKDWNHIYHLSQANPLDVAVLDTHDTPSIQMFFNSLPDDKKAQFSWQLACDLRFNYNENLKSTKELVRMQWGALLASPAERVGAFFTSWTGQIGRYNEPGNPVKWQLRCVSDFDQLYFENLAKGLAYNPFDAIALAIYARGDEFYHKNEKLVQNLRAAEKDILDLAVEL